MSTNPKIICNIDYRAEFESHFESSDQIDTKKYEFLAKSIFKNALLFPNYVKHYAELCGKITRAELMAKGYYPKKLMLIKVILGVGSQLSARNLLRIFSITLTKFSHNFSTVMQEIE